MLDIFNYVDFYYKMLDTRVVVSSILVWEEGDQVGPHPFYPNQTIKEFEKYAQNVIYKINRAKVNTFVLCRRSF